MTKDNSLDINFISKDYMYPGCIYNIYLNSDQIKIIEGDNLSMSFDVLRYYPSTKIIYTCNLDVFWYYDLRDYTDCLNFTYDELLKLCDKAARRYEMEKQLEKRS